MKRKIKFLPNKYSAQTSCRVVQRCGLRPSTGLGLLGNWVERESQESLSPCSRERTRLDPFVMTVPPEAEAPPPNPCNSNDLRASDLIDDDEVLSEIPDPCSGGTDEVNGIAVPIIVDASFIVTPGPEVYCLTEASCALAAASQDMPIITGSFGTVTKGCFTKGGVAYFSEGTPEEMSDPDPAPPAQTRLFCTGVEVQEPLETSELQLADDKDETLRPVEGASSTCRTEDDCKTAALAIGLRFQSVVAANVGTVGCFKKGSTAYFVPGNEVDMSKVDLAGVRERIYCDFTAQSETSVEGTDESAALEIGDIESEETGGSEETGDIESELAEASDETGEKAEAATTVEAVASGGEISTTNTASLPVDDSSQSIAVEDGAEDNDGDESDSFLEVELQRLENEIARLELELPFPAPLPPSTISVQVEAASGIEPDDTASKEVSQVTFEDELKRLKNEVEMLETKLAEDGDWNVDPEMLMELEKLKNTLDSFENELNGEDEQIDIDGEDQTEDKGQTEDEDQLAKINVEEEDQTSTAESSSESAEESSTSETAGSDAPDDSLANISVSEPDPENSADETVETHLPDVESPALTTTVALEEVSSSTPTTFNATTTTAPANEQSASTTVQSSSTTVSTQVTSITTTSSALKTPASAPSTDNDWDHADHSCLSFELKQTDNTLKSASSNEMTITYDYDLRTILPLDGETLSSFENYIASDVAMNSCFLRRQLVENSRKLLRGNRRSTSLIVRGFSSNPVDKNMGDQCMCLP